MKIWSLPEIPPLTKKKKKSIRKTEKLNLELFFSDNSHSFYVILYQHLHLKQGRYSGFREVLFLLGVFFIYFFKIPKLKNALFQMAHPRSDGHYGT